MSDEDALLAAIIANPDEDTPRLVYADWLQENNQLERAEFIRLQIESSLLAIDDPRRGEVDHRGTRLLTQYRKPWTKALRELLPSARLEFSRGFVEEIEAEGSSYPRVANDVSCISPIRAVLLRNCGNLCELNRHASLDRARLTVLANPHQPGAPRRTITLLRQAPNSLELALKTGNWLILAWAVWSGQDTLAVQRFERVLRASRLNTTVRFGLRPFDEHWEFSSWCPGAPEYSSPLWLRFSAGEFVSHHIGLVPPAPLREFWS